MNVVLIIFVTVSVYFSRLLTEVANNHVIIFIADYPTIFFDTQEVSKADSDHPLNAVS